MNQHTSYLKPKNYLGLKLHSESGIGEDFDAGIISKTGKLHWFGAFLFLILPLLKIFCN